MINGKGTSISPVWLTWPKEHNGFQVSKLGRVYCQVSKGTRHLRQLPDVVGSLGGLVGVGKGMGVGGRGEERAGRQRE